MNKKGQATLEFALAVVLVFTFLFALIDFGMMFYVNLTMENAVREGVRHVITGQEKIGQENYLRNALKDTISRYSAGFYDKNASPDAKDGPSVSVRDVRNFANYSGASVTDTGGGGQVIMVSLNYAWPLMTPVVRPFFKDGKYTFTVRTTMRNEPWGDQ